MNHSIWGRTQALPRFQRLDGDTNTDVLIVGGGLAGILTAHMLSEAGIDYLLIEADRICSGVSRNTTAKITSQHGLIYDKLTHTLGFDAARLYWEAHEMALNRYRQLAETIACDFETKDSYVYSVSSPEKLAQEMAALKKLRIPAEYTEHLPLPISVAGAIRFTAQAQFHPLKFAYGIAASLNIREQTRAEEFKGNAVMTNRGRIRARKIIIATHFPILNKHGGYFLKMYQDRSYILALEHAQDVGGMYLDECERGLSFRNHGKFLLLGGGAHRTGKQSRAWAPLESFAKVHYPDSPITHHWATQDCMTLDSMPYIGQYGSHTRDLYVATGFNKWGMTGSMLSAMILSDLIQGNQNPYAELFSPSRSMLHKQLFTNAFEATVNLLTPTRPRCPHLGCALKWNAQERSWDCPCHGSRFAEDGKLLDSPSTGDLG